jgi:hypothetical protein
MSVQSVQAGNIGRDLGTFSLEVDDQFDFRGLLDGQVGRVMILASGVMSTC